MKINKNIFIAFLSISIILFSFSNCYFISYATHGGGGGDNHGVLTSEEKKEMVKGIVDNFGKYCTFIIAQLGAFSSGSFATALENYELLEGMDWKSHVWNEDNIYIDDDGDIVFSDELVSLIKQALTEYAEESCGFWIVPTVNFNLIGANNFYSLPAYQTLKNIVNEKEVVLTQTGYMFKYMYIYDIYNSDMPFVLVCSSSSYDYEKNLGKDVPCYFYGADNWLWYSLNYYTYTFDADSIAFESFDAYKETSYEYVDPGKYATGFYMNYTRGYDYSSVSPYKALISKDGRHMKVYKSLDAYKYACTNTRSVYFGSGFYDEVGEVKVSFDQLQDYLDGKYDSFFDDLKELLPDNDAGLSEDEIEKIVDKLLGKLDDIGGDIGGDIDKVDGSLKETNSILGGIASALSGYFESVLSYLDSILVSIQGLIFVEQIKPDDEHLDLSDMINDVWKDPQNGSQAVADSLSASFSDIASALMAKFPFCIPHDLYSLFNVFTNTPKGRASPASVDDSSIQLYSGADSVPCFELPLVIESLGIEEVIVIDMADFQPLSTVLRVFISLIFAVALMKFSATVIQLINNAWGGIS